jgi:hypothetical protein
MGSPGPREPPMIGPIAHTRLRNQSISAPRLRDAADVVRWLGAVQAQEYEPAKWGLGLRIPGSVEPEIERAFEDGRILRTHVMRPTWHFVTPADIRWLLDLTGPRVLRMMRGHDRLLELDEKTVVRGLGVIERALGGRQYLTRLEIGVRLKRARLVMAGSRLANLMMHAELEGLVCSGPRRGKQSTYALIAERAPKARRLSRDEALAELSRRFFQSHGPATARDFSWWSGLTMADARRGLDMNRGRREDVGELCYWCVGKPAAKASRDTAAHLLPIYDEYLVSYRDRVAVPHGPSTVPSGRTAVTFQHAIVISGQVAGTWRHASRTPQAVVLSGALLRPITKRERGALDEAARRYAHFVGRPVTLTVD